MDEQKRLSEEEQTEETKNDSKEPNSNKKSSMSSRARNRTVMLSPEMTGQVRAMLYKSNDSQQTNDSLNKGTSNNDWSRPEVKSVLNNPLGTDPFVARGEAVSKEEASSRVADSVPNLNLEQGLNSRATGKMNPDFLNQVMSNLNKQAPIERREPVVAPVVSVVTPVPSNFVPAGPKVRVNAIEEPKKVATSKLVGFLISFDGNEFGEIFEVRAGRWLITSRPTDQGEFIFINDSSVSPMHAVVRVTKEGKVQILDQLSEYGTGIIKVGNSEEVDVAGSMITVEHGDMIRFGNRHFVVCLVPDFRKQDIVL